jgi:hypothetical protein
VNLGRILAIALASGIAGWALENALAPKQGGNWSKAFGGRRVPLLPVYAAGGAAVALATPHLSGLSVPARFGVYAAGLSALELGAGALDRTLPGRPSWSYGLAGAVVDVPHALAWGGLGLLVEAAARSSSSQQMSVSGERSRDPSELQRRAAASCERARAAYSASVSGSARKR